MSRTKKRRDIEVYENYWKFTAAHLDITGTKFHNCLHVIVRFIDQNRSALEEHAQSRSRFSESALYRTLQQQIVDLSGFRGGDAALSARKAINQFVKIGFVYPFLAGYHPLVKPFLRAESKEKKEILFSRIFYEGSSLASDVTVDRRNLKHVPFLLKTLDHNGSLNRNDMIALMVTDITNYRAGYLTREELDQQYRYARISEFDERKYNQIAHLTGYLKHFVDLKYDKNEERFWFADDPLIADRDFGVSFARDGVRHRIYKEELKEESRELYGEAVCYLDKKPYRSLIASHIKPCADCLKEHREDQAYDVDNGLLLSPTADSYFDQKDISFADDGTVLIGKRVAEAVRADFTRWKLDERVLNERRKRYLACHRRLFEQKNGGNG